MPDEPSEEWPGCPKCGQKEMCSECERLWGEAIGLLPVADAEDEGKA